MSQFESERTFWSEAGTLPMASFIMYEALFSPIVSRAFSSICRFSSGGMPKLGDVSNMAFSSQPDGGIDLQRDIASHSSDKEDDCHNDVRACACHDDR